MLRARVDAAASALSCVCSTALLRMGRGRPDATRSLCESDAARVAFPGAAGSPLVWELKACRRQMRCREFREIVGVTGVVGAQQARLAADDAAEGADQGLHRAVRCALRCIRCGAERVPCWRVPCCRASRGVFCVLIPHADTGGAKSLLASLLCQRPARPAPHRHGRGARRGAGMVRKSGIALRLMTAAPPVSRSRAASALALVLAALAAASLPRGGRGFLRYDGGDPDRDWGAEYPEGFGHGSPRPPSLTEEVKWLVKNSFGGQNLWDLEEIVGVYVCVGMQGRGKARRRGGV
eukprot:103597-Chlamydomonas_euryale.AAC.7